MTEEQERALKELLHGRPLIVPAMVYGLLGGDPNDLLVEEFGTIARWLHELGYEPRKRSRFLNANFMSVWVREEVWQGETGKPKPYAGIPLRRDRELRLTREEKEERRERRRAFHRSLREL